MKLGAMYPQYEMGAAPDDLRRFAQAAEAMGFDYFSYPDHVVAADPYRDPPIPDLFTERDQWQDPFVIFCYLAGLTKTIELFTGIMILPQRQTALLARQAADVDLLSKGRLWLAIGLGWNYAEYEAMGLNYHERGRRADEQLPLLRMLWSEPIVSFNGEYDKVDRAGLNPLPKRRIPIWFGGASEPAYHRAAKWGDGFVFEGNMETATAKAERVMHHRRELGMPVEGYGLQMMTASLDRFNFAGPQPGIDSLRAWRDWGGTHGSVATTEQGFKTIDQHIDFLAEVHHALTK